MDQLSLKGKKVLTGRRFSLSCLSWWSIFTVLTPVYISPSMHTFIPLVLCMNNPFTDSQLKILLKLNNTSSLGFLKRAFRLSSRSNSFEF